MKRKQILESVLRSLAGIKTDSGYNTNLGDNVYYWQDLEFEYGEAGAISLSDEVEDVTHVNLQRYHRELTLNISAIAFSQDILADGDKMLSDLEVALTQDESLGGLAIKSEITQNIKEIETSGKKAIRVGIEFHVTYRDT